MTMATSKCKVPMFFAYISVVYISASLFYLLMTRAIGTPFNDSLTEKQINIKNEAASQRKIIFLQGVILSTIAIVIFQPFSSCD